MPALTDLDIPAFGAWLADRGLNRSHALRILRAFYRDGGRVDLAGLRVGRAVERALAAELPLRQSRIAGRSDASDGTSKLLVSFDRGGAVEAVLMPSHRPDRAAGCLSSQVGCAMGCDFCASTRNGLDRNLTAGEIVEQFLHLRREALLLGRRLVTLVFMGMGEPMHNLDAVIESIRRIAGPNLGELGGRQITVSTVGVVPGIDRLAEADLNVHLAVSLHGPDDATRSAIVPAGRRYPVADILAAARRFQERTGRVVNVEYTLLAGVNDSDAQAAALAEVLGDFRAHVNVIPYNPIGAGVSGRVYLPPSAQRVQRFVELLRGRGVVTHARRPRGDDVRAACGQLATTSAR